MINCPTACPQAVAQQYEILSLSSSLFCSTCPSSGSQCTKSSYSSRSSLSLRRLRALPTSSGCLFVQRVSVRSSGSLPRSAVVILAGRCWMVRAGAMRRRLIWLTIPLMCRHHELDSQFRYTVGRIRRTLSTWADLYLAECATLPTFQDSQTHPRQPNGHRSLLFP